jgi:hypothetical protein
MILGWGSYAQFSLSYDALRNSKPSGVLSESVYPGTRDHKWLRRRLLRRHWGTFDSAHTNDPNGMICIRIRGSAVAGS